MENTFVFWFAAVVEFIRICVCRLGNLSDYMTAIVAGVERKPAVSTKRTSMPYPAIEFLPNNNKPPKSDRRISVVRDKAFPTAIRRLILAADLHSSVEDFAAFGIRTC